MEDQAASGQQLFWSADKKLEIGLQIHHFTNGDVWLYVPPVYNAWSSVEVLESFDDSVVCQWDRAGSNFAHKF